MHTWCALCWVQTQAECNATLCWRVPLLLLHLRIASMPRAMPGNSARIGRVAGLLKEVVAAVLQRHGDKADVQAGGLNALANLANDPGTCTCSSPSTRREMGWGVH